MSLPHTLQYPSIAKNRHFFVADLPGKVHNMTLTDSSVAKWLERLEAGEDIAATRLWNAYFDRMVHLAHGRLQAKHRMVSDAEDIALSAFHSFCRGVENKKFPDLSDRHGLWRRHPKNCCLDQERNLE